MENLYVFYILLLKYNIIKKRRVDETTSQLKFEANDKSKKYKVKKIWNNVIYTRESKSHLSKFYYLVLWKNYSEKKNTWKSILTI